MPSEVRLWGLKKNRDRLTLEFLSAEPVEGIRAVQGASSRSELDRFVCSVTPM